VIIGDPKKDKSEILWRALGRFIEGLGGRYITAEDAGTTMQDMEFIRMETSWVVGISRALGGSGDPSPVTALGVFWGMTFDNYAHVSTYELWHQVPRVAKSIQNDPTFTRAMNFVTASQVVVGVGILLKFFLEGRRLPKL
jgi:hypothetical protein